TEMAPGGDDAVYLARSRRELPADGIVMALDRKDGRVNWSVPIEGEPAKAFGQGPDHTLYLGSYVCEPTGPNTAAGAHGFLFALDSRDGHEKWRFRAGSGVVGVPAYRDGKVLVGSYDHHFYALDARHPEVPRRGAPEGPAGADPDDTGGFPTGWRGSGGGPRKPQAVGKLHRRATQPSRPQSYERHWNRRDPRQSG
ncbi:MAG: PQQ-binding-like beta-propeller repeat protein, partial [Candidatus Eremiobacterota bacterium]